MGKRIPRKDSQRKYNAFNSLVFFSSCKLTFMNCLPFWCTNLAKFPPIVFYNVTLRSGDLAGLILKHEFFCLLLSWCARRRTYLFPAICVAHVLICSSVISTYFLLFIFPSDKFYFHLTLVTNFPKSSHRRFSFHQ